MKSRPWWEGGRMKVEGGAGWGYKEEEGEGEKKNRYTTNERGTDEGGG